MKWLRHTNEQTAARKKSQTCTLRLLKRGRRRLKPHDDKHKNSGFIFSLKADFPQCLPNCSFAVTCPWEKTCSIMCKVVTFSTLQAPGSTNAATKDQTNHKITQLEEHSRVHLSNLATLGHDLGAFGPQPTEPDTPTSMSPADNKKGTVLCNTTSKYFRAGCTGLTNIS